MLKFIFLLKILVTVTARSVLINLEPDLLSLPEVNGDKFYYFGYGSNMLAKRIHIQNPTAVRIGEGLLKDYRLDFNTYTSRWNGAPATVVPHFNRTVHGTVWEIDLSNLDDIDNQEGVHEGYYRPASVSILMKKNQTITARVYLLTKQPVTDLKDIPWEEVPYGRQPSKTYLQCLVKGAVETGIEADYVNWLRSIRHNGNVVQELEDILELKDIKLDS